MEKVVELLKRAGITAEGFSARLDQAERKKRLDQIKSDDQKASMCVSEAHDQIQNYDITGKILKHAGKRPNSIYFQTFCL